MHDTADRLSSKLVILNPEFLPEKKEFQKTMHFLKSLSAFCGWHLEYILGMPV